MRILKTQQQRSTLQGWESLNHEKENKGHAGFGTRENSQCFGAVHSKTIVPLENKTPSNLESESKRTGPLVAWPLKVGPLLCRHKSKFFARAKNPCTIWLDDRGTGQRKLMEEVPRRTSLVPLAFPCFVLCLKGVDTEGLFRLPGAGGDHFHCTVEPSPGHFRCRKNWATYEFLEWGRCHWPELVISVIWFLYNVKMDTKSLGNKLLMTLWKPPKTGTWVLRESFCESGEGVRLPRERADLRGSPGTSGEVGGTSRGSLGNFRGTSGLLLSSTVRELPGKSPKNFRGEVRGTSGEVRGLPRSSGQPDSLPATRQICLQWKPPKTGIWQFLEGQAIQHQPKARTATRTDIWCNISMAFSLSCFCLPYSGKGTFFRCGIQRGPRDEAKVVVVAL